MKEIVNVVCIIPSLYSGAGTVNVMMNHIRFIDRSRIHFSVIVYKTIASPFYDELEKLGVPIIKIPKPNIFNTKIINRIIKMSFKQMEIVPDIVHYYDLLLIPFTQKLFRLEWKSTILAHTLSSKLSENTFNAFRNFFIAYPIRFLCDYFWACSLPAGRVWFGQRIVNSNKFRIIKEAIDATKYRYNNQFEISIKEEFSLNGKKIIGHIGRFNKNKNQSFLLDVMQVIVKGRQDVILLLVGYGELFDDITKKAKNLGIEKYIVMTGLREDANNFYSAFDCFCLPSYTEGYGLVALEAQTAGVQTIISSLIPNDVMVTDIITALPIDGVVLWANKILEILDNPVLDRYRYYQSIREQKLDLDLLGLELTYAYLNMHDRG